MKAFNFDKKFGSGDDVTQFLDLPKARRPGLEIKQNKANYFKDHNWHQYIVCNKNYLTQELKQLLNDPDRHMKENILKSDQTNTTTVSLATIDNKDIIIKRYNLKNFVHRLKRAIQPSRAVHCWKRAHQLLEYGIATPIPIAIIEKRWGIFRKEAYFIYEFIPGEEGFVAFANKPKHICKIRAEKTLQLIAKLFNNNFSHGDMKASNFIYYNNEPYFIDLDAVKRHRFSFTFTRKRRKETKRFLENWTEPEVQSLFGEFKTD